VFSEPARKEGIRTRKREDHRLLGPLLAVPPQALDSERRRELLEAAAARSRRSSRGALGRVRTNGWPLVQTAIAAALAWLIASKLLRDPSPFFAPVAAIMSLAATRGQRMRRAIELIIGRSASGSVICSGGASAWANGSLR
jgi:hypothetical protein